MLCIEIIDAYSDVPTIYKRIMCAKLISNFKTPDKYSYNSVL
jgi:hypothetical protein